MDAKTIRGLQPMLARFLKRFDDCFARKDTRAHLAVYVNGQLSDLPRKSRTGTRTDYGRLSNFNRRPDSHG